MTLIVALRDTARRLANEAALRARAYELCAESQRVRAMALSLAEVSMAAATGTTIVLAAFDGSATRSAVCVGIGFVLIVQPLLTKLGLHLNNPVHIERFMRASAAFAGLSRGINASLLDGSENSAAKLRRLLDRASADYAQACAASEPLTSSALQRARRKLAEERVADAELFEGEPEVLLGTATRVSPLQRIVLGVLIPAASLTLGPYLVVTSALSVPLKVVLLGATSGLALSCTMSLQRKRQSHSESATPPLAASSPA